MKKGRKEIETGKKVNSSHNASKANEERKKAYMQEKVKRREVAKAIVKRSVSFLEDDFVLFLLSLSTY
jgi:hypothetical protein